MSHHKLTTVVVFIQKRKVFGKMFCRWNRFYLLWDVSDRAF
jgi:hypothetical protein